MSKTAQMIESIKAGNSLSSARRSTKAKNPEADKRGKHPNSLANLQKTMFKPGQSGNPGGKPKDVAGALARVIIEETLTETFDGFKKQLAAGNAYAFSVLSDRAYGKLKQGIIHTGDEEGGPIQACIKVEFVEPDGK